MQGQYCQKAILNLFPLVHLIHFNPDTFGEKLLVGEDVLKNTSVEELLDNVETDSEQNLRSTLEVLSSV